jgi:uncharacterized protein (TIGR03083 family)
MKAPAPVIVVDLFPAEREQLLLLLSQLDEAEWHRPTICTGWTVKDIALHLLGDDIGKLSRARDYFEYVSETNSRIDSWDELVTYINEMNALWVQATRRMSGRLLCELLAFTGEEICQYFRSLDPYATGELVSWAGPGPAPVWLDIAREYTERWLHQQQIRDAVERPGLKERRFFAPVLATFVRALPHTFRDVTADEQTLVQLTITGESGGQWFLLRENGRWILGEDAPTNPQARVTIDQEDAWRLFTKGISKDQALERALIEGNRELGLKVLDTVSIIA